MSIIYCDIIHSCGRIHNWFIYSSKAWIV